MTKATIICLALVAILWTTATPQTESVGAKPIQMPGRHTLKGALTRAVARKSFSEHFSPGLYRLTYLSKTAPAVIELRTQDRVIGRSGPTQPFATVLSGRTGEPVDLKPTGLCSSDVAADGDCAVEKIHFRVAHTQTISIEVTGVDQLPGDFTILVDPLQETPEVRTLGSDRIATAYLAFNSEQSSESPQAEFSVQLAKGMRLGVLLASPDFTTALEARDSVGNLVASSSDFNNLLDPCREVRTDRLPNLILYHNQTRT